MIANQPWYLGGVIDADASQKAAKFVRTCNSYGLPLVVLVDTPGFLPGTKQEGLGVIRHGAKLLHAFAEAVVPKVTVVLRKAYGGGFITMNSKDLGADLALAWPDAQIGIMGAKQAVGIVHRSAIAAADDPEAEHDRLAEDYEADHVSAAIAAREGFIDELVAPQRDPAPAGGRAAGAVGRRRLRQRRREHPAVTTYVAMGDSFTAGLDPSMPRWPDELARFLGGRYVNLAEVGATSEHVEREQLERALELSPDVVTLVCGANDVLLDTRPDADAYAERLSRMFARLRRELPRRDDHDRDVSGHLPLPRAPPASRTRVERGMKRFNAACRAVARRHHVVLLEGFDHPATDERSTFAEDGFHPSAEGHRAAAASSSASSRFRARRVTTKAPARPAGPRPDPPRARDRRPAESVPADELAITPAARRPPPPASSAGRSASSRCGDRFTTPARTVQEADILQFADLTGDAHPQHVDPEWAAGSRFGEQIAHGLLVLSFAVGLLPLDPERVVALRRVGDAVFKQPVKIGDTLHVEGEITRTRELDPSTGSSSRASGS